MPPHARSDDRPGGGLGALLAAVLVLGPATAQGAGEAAGRPLVAGFADVEVAARAAELAAQAGRPEAIVPLLGLLDLWSELDDRGALVSLLDAARGDPRQLPEVRARAAFLRAIVAGRTGRTGEEALAAELFAGLGLIADFQVLGPFDNQGRASDARELSPERDLGLPLVAAATYPGKEHPVSWRRYPRSLVREGLVALDAALSPEQHVVGYATTWVRVEHDVDCAVRLGSSGAATVWVEGRRVLQGDAYRPVRLDQSVAGAHLVAGWNRLTIKLGADEGGWAFLLRLTAVDGGPLSFVASAEPPARARPGAPRGNRRPPAPPAVSDLSRALKAAADSGAQAAQRAYGLYLHHVAPEEPRLGAAERVLTFAAELGRDVTGYRLAALAASDDEKARKLLEEAVAPGRAGSASERARALTELGNLYDRLHRERRAEALWQEALRADPDHFPAALHLCELAESRGLPSLARSSLAEVVRRHPAPLSVIRAQAQLAERQGRRAEAEGFYRALLGASRDDLWALQKLARLARGRGQVEAADQLLVEMIRVRPDMASLRAERATLLDGVGRSEQAHAVLQAALADSPDQAGLLELDGKVLHRMGREPEALAAIGRSLELHPQDPPLRAYAAAIRARLGREAAEGHGAAPSSDLAQRFAAPLDQLVARAAQATPPTGEPAWVLLDRQVVRVLPNGLSQTFSQRVVKILDERGAREQGQAAIRYAPDSQSVEVKAARVRKPGGEIIEAASQSDQETSEPWYGLYYDTRALVIELSNLEPGDVVDVEYVLSDVGSRNLFGDYFGALELLQEQLPRLESEFIVIAPAGRALYFNQPTIPGVGPITAEHQVEGGEHRYRFHAERVPPIQAEPAMPGVTSVGAYVHVSTFQSWQEMAEWYRGLVRGQLDPDDAIREAVRQALKELAESARAAHRPVDERARIGAIYDLVVKSTRYVGLEFGIHGYKPYRVAQVFQRKFGDCKDKASLLVAMLRLAGIDASLVLLRTRRGGDLAPYPASLAPFDHAIAWVPRYDLFLDGTAEFSGSGELPAQDQDVPVLIVSDPRSGGRGHLVRTPVLPAEQNRVARSSEVVLAESGQGQVKLSIEVSGQAAHEWRNHYQSAGERRERLEKSENAGHPGARVDQVEFSPLEELEQPVRMTAALEVPGWARPAALGAGAAGLVMPALGREGDLSRTYARLSERQHDLVLGYPWQQEEKVLITPPAGFAVARLPPAASIESPFGRFTMAAERSGSAVRVSAQLVVRRHRISAAEYPAFRRFCLDVDRAAAGELVMAREAP